MPIVGLTHQLPAFPRIGELRKGDVKGNNRPGKNLTYFRFTSTDSDALQTFRAAYGNEPRHVNCYLPYPTTDENFEAWIEEWGAGSLKWRGDGQNLVLWQTPQDTYSTEPKAQPHGGKQIGRLKMIVPELKRMAYVTALTTSVNDIMELHANLSAYEALRGSLTGIPFILSRIPREISTPGKDGKRMRREEWLLHIEAQPAWVQAQLGAMRMQALPAAQKMVALDTGEIIDYDTETVEGELLEDDDTARYLDGSVVDDKALEFYFQYQAVHPDNEAPESANALREWYKAQKAAETE